MIYPFLCLITHIKLTIQWLMGSRKWCINLWSYIILQWSKLQHSQSLFSQSQSQSTVSLLLKHKLLQWLPLSTTWTSTLSALRNWKSNARSMSRELWSHAPRPLKLEVLMLLLISSVPRICWLIKNIAGLVFVLKLKRRHGMSSDADHSETYISSLIPYQ